MSDLGSGAVAFDHAVYAGASLDALVDAVERLTQVRPVRGGTHEGLGTHNALLGLGEGRYLELLAPLPAQPGEEHAGFAKLLAGLSEPRLFMWAVRVSDVSELVERGAAAGLEMGSVAEMSRTPPGAPAQHWKLSTGGADVYGSVLPFGIQWLTPGHPSEGLAPGCALAGFRAEHPEPGRIRSALETIGFPLPVIEAAVPALILTLDTPAGVVAIR